MKTFGDVVDFLRGQVLRDSADPPIWSDEALAEFVSQGHDRFAEDVLYIRDSTSEVTRITLEAGVDLYALNAAILGVLSAKIEGTQDPLIRVGTSDLDGETPATDTVSWLDKINSGVVEEGTPQAFTTDTGRDEEMQPLLRVYPVPAAADDGKVILMRVTRLTLNPCTVDNLDDIPECPRQYLMALVHAAAQLAYATYDADGEDSVRAKEQERLYNIYVQRGKIGLRRLFFQPLTWGFGRGGFTHSR